jgi:hypothetical protein
MGLITWKNPEQKEYAGRGAGYGFCIFLSVRITLPVPDHQRLSLREHRDGEGKDNLSPA